MSQQKPKPLNLLKAANENKKKYKRFDIDLGEGNFLTAIMTAPDVFQIAEEQEVIYQTKYAEYVKKGMHKQQINEADWEKDKNLIIEGMEKSATKFTRKDVNERIAREKPNNLAEQVAKKVRNLQTIRELIPKVIRIHDGEQTRLLTDEEREAFQELICSDMKLFTRLSQIWVELFTDVTSVSDTAKNSFGEANLENSDSKKPVPDDGKDIKDPSTFN